MTAAAFLGLRTAKYSARDLAAAREWYRRVLGFGFFLAGGERLYPFAAVAINRDSLEA